ncbi:hypothetical protein HAPAU_07950 [Halalkalicoccus paucihalophilus]|uniref:Uncharacterized protein n=1 Tax=Halalkalicoccus paucihalophilus TaxID=1008153 RepID=A0A151AHH9_9EURY|nr:DUF5784 family protein [Halalkalicoccus paucihalophilus]KYH26907.1 hypothetical protein HAPAU_07950 [Halalkalicoccus paucihalophilus]
MARPLRFRRSPQSWSEDRLQRDLFRSLDDAIGARCSTPWFSPGGGYEARRFDMDNGDTALFIWDDDEAYWLGNTQTPSTLWRTEKYTFDEVPYPVARWAQRELLAELHEAEPWLAAYPHLSWFFLPVFCSKDGRETTREFFREHTAGFPDTTRADACGFYESVLHSGVLDEYRYVMASKLGTSDRLDPVRMSATMSEFTVAHLLTRAGYEITPEIEVTTGHSIDFRAEKTGTSTLVEVTRPLPPTRRAANTAVAAVTETAKTKTSGQLSEHGGGISLFVDCSSFRDDEWARVRGEQPSVGHRPAVVFRARPSGRIEAYSKGSVPLDLGNVEWF